MPRPRGRNSREILRPVRKMEEEEEEEEGEEREEREEEGEGEGGKGRLGIQVHPSGRRLWKRRLSLSRRSDHLNPAPVQQKTAQQISQQTPPTCQGAALV